MGNNVLSGQKLRVRATGLRQCLDERGIKYSFVARKIGLWPSGMTGLLQGTRTINKAQADQVCELVGVPFFVAFEIADAHLEAS